jgi:hypothetical protein
MCNKTIHVCNKVLHFNVCQNIRSTYFEVFRKFKSHPVTEYMEIHHVTLFVCHSCSCSLLTLIQHVTDGKSLLLA